MSTAVFPTWLSSICVKKISPNGRRCILYSDKFSGHIVMGEHNRASASIKTELRYYPQRNPSHPALWYRCYPKDRTSLEYSVGISQDGNDQQNMSKNKAEKIANPDKTYFLKLAAKCIQFVNNQFEENRLSTLERPLFLLDRFFIQMARRKRRGWPFSCNISKANAKACSVLLVRNPWTFNKETVGRIKLCF